MGLLDDAIREHLELKRRRGGDPGEIAHQERSALDPVFPDEAVADPVAGGDPAVAEDVGYVEDAGAPAEALLEGDAADGEARLADLSNLGQETAELDMHAVLHAEDPGPGSAGSGPTQPDLDDDPLDWETPASSAERAPGELPGQSRLSFE